MATLQNIRKRGPLIAIVIGIALLAFIVGDLTQSGTAMFNGGKFDVAEIEGKSLSIQDYENKVTETREYIKLIQGSTTLDENTDNQIRTSVWDMLVRNYILEDDVKKLGLGVHADEMMEMAVGMYIDPIIKRTFSNPETGEFDPAYVAQIVQGTAQDPTLNQIWMYIENEVKENRIYTKYVNMVQKGMYVTKFEAEKDFNEKGHIVDFDYVAKNYNTVPDSTLEISDAELKKYYEEHKNLFEQEESRSVAYVTFDILPSKSDSAATLAQINELKTQFEKAEDAEQFVKMQSDFPFDPRYKKPQDFRTNGLDTLLFNSEIGFVYGPYIENGAYTLTKLLDVTEISDSASVRHILISPQNPKVGTMERAKVLADSLLEVINNGGDFEQLVTDYTDDPGSKDKGGVYEDFTEGTMVKPFNDFSFQKEVGETGVVETEYGYHIIEVLKQSEPKKKVKVANVQIQIEPSQETYDETYALAARFAGENNTKELFEKAIQEQGLVMREAPNLTQATSAIPGLQSAREVVRWAFSAEVNNVSPSFDLVDKYAVVILTDAKEKGIAPFEQAKEKVLVEVAKEKKAEMFAEEFKAVGSENLADYASKFKVQRTSATSVSFNAFQVAGMGYEPAILAKVQTMEQGKFYGPIKGENGVYVLKVKSVTPATVEENHDWNADKQTLAKALQGRASYQAYEALKTLANIKDNRAKFF